MGAAGNVTPGALERAGIEVVVNCTSHRAGEHLDRVPGITRYQFESAPRLTMMPRCCS